MSSNTTLSGAARSRLLAFNGFVWIFGVVAIILIGIAVLAETGDEVSASDDYGYEPWLNPDPVLADDEGDGVYSGVDGAMVALDGLDPAQPLLITELDDTYVGRVSVTGPGGEILTEGEYGGPAEFESYIATEGQWVIVPQADVELWIDGFRDERWRMRITTPPVEERSGTVSGIGSTVFALGSAATTARISTRGEGRVSIETVTSAGVTEVFSENEPTDRSIAWADGDPVLFVIDAWDDAGWTIAFADEPAPAATGAPTPTSAPSATGVSP
ncbi:MAG TPA: hypothetical protein VIP82_13470 [Microbacterium sp.]|uniref:hypothetical protein n=1 Tax=Microbacterium sp. TaxID=51671 RepID=UPI002F95519E